MASRKFVILTFCIFYVSFSIAQISPADIDKVAERALKAFDVPGIAVAIVKDGKIVHAKGYGVRSLQTNQKVDENTLFGVASNSKAFTSAALGMLVDEGKIRWDDPVIDYIPEFRLYNPYVTSVFTIRDLLTHRSGLGLGAGDLMFWPDSSDFTVKDIIHNLRFLKQTSGFRTKYDYDNLMYIVAGEVVARVSGMTWEDFIEGKIIKPLGMLNSAAGFDRLKNKSNVIDGHALVNGKVQVIKRDYSVTANGAAGIYSSVADMSKWVIMQLDNGKFGSSPGQQLFSEEVHEEMWTPQTIIPVKTQSRSSADQYYNTHFRAYGLGWGLSDVGGLKQVGHSGGLAGMVTLVTLIPEKKLGIMVFTNQQSSAAFSAVTNTIKDSFLGLPARDWVAIYQESSAKSEASASKITDEVHRQVASLSGATDPKEASQFTGTYKDSWFGDVVISQRNNALWFASRRSPRLQGEMLKYKGNTYVVKWKDRSFDADAFVVFSLNSEGKAAGMKMAAISPLTDFSFDFQDLDFIRTGD